MEDTNALSVVLAEPGSNDGYKQEEMTNYAHGWLNATDIAVEWQHFLERAVDKYPAGTIFRVYASEPATPTKQTWVTWAGE